MIVDASYPSGYFAKMEDQLRLVGELLDDTVPLRRANGQNSGVLTLGIRE